MRIASVGDKPCLIPATESQISDHPLSADIADQFSSQQVKLFAVIASGIPLILRLDLLHLCKQLFPDDCRTTTIDADVVVLLSVVISLAICSCSCLIEHKNTSIFLIRKNLIKAILPEHLASFCLVAMSIESLDNFTVTIAIRKHLKNDFYRLSFPFIDDQLSVFIQIISQWWTASCVFALQSGFIHAFHDFSSQIFAVVLGHTLQNRFHHNAFWGIVHTLQYTAKLDVVLFQFLFVNGTVVTVS